MNGTPPPPNISGDVDKRIDARDAAAEIVFIYRVCRSRAVPSIVADIAASTYLANKDLLRMRVGHLPWKGDQLAEKYAGERALVYAADQAEYLAEFYRVLRESDIPEESAIRQTKKYAVQLLLG